MRAREVHLKHRRSADGQEVRELVFESARAPPLRTKSLGWLNRDSRAKPAVPFEGDTPKEFTNLLRLADSLKEKKLTIALEDRRHYMRTWGKHMAPDIRTIFRHAKVFHPEPKRARGRPSKKRGNKVEQSED